MLLKVAIRICVQCDNESYNSKVGHFVEQQYLTAFQGLDVC